MTRLPQQLEKAIQHHIGGHLAEAEAAYQLILTVQPRHPDALHLLGVIAYQTGRHEQSHDLISRALKAHPGFPEAHSNLGNTLRAMGRLEEAAVHYRKVLQLPGNPDTAARIRDILREPDMARCP